MEKEKETGLGRLWKATGYSMAGLKAAWRQEEAFRQEAVTLVMLVPLGLWLGDTPVERVLLVCSCLAVLVTELINSALEAVVDRIGPERHPLSGAAKDLGSAAVFVALVAVAVVWGLIIAGHLGA
jgi:diacylglycerol kinase (ATP)